jgi:hypothetical protein
MAGPEEEPVDDEEEELFVHGPDVKDDDSKKHGLICFLNDMRECNQSCMAYTTAAAASKDLNKQQKHCVLLVGTERLGRHTGVLAQLVHDSLSHQRTVKADEARSQQKPPTGPLGKPASNQRT